MELATRREPTRRETLSAALENMSISLPQPELIPKDVLFEEETVPTYSSLRFYPARIGEDIGGKYRIICKLGFGARSTIWLAKTLNGHISAPYVVLKICLKDVSTTRERDLMRRIGSTNPAHPATEYTRLLLDSFDMTSPYTTYAVLVVPPLREPLNMLQTRLKGEVYPLAAVKGYIKILLLVLSYLHDECHIVHTDIQPENILVGFEEEFDLDMIEEQEKLIPAPRKVLKDRTIYASVQDFGWPEGVVGRPKVIDLDLALPLEKGQSYSHSIQLHPYRAPEVTLGQEWKFPVDIWSVAAMSWDLLEGKALFPGLDEQDRFSTHLQTAQIIALVGLPPKKFATKGEKWKQFFDKYGKPLPSVYALIPGRTFEDTITKIDGEDKREFIRFMRRMLQWAPDDRAKASELLKDPYMANVSLA